MAEVSELLCPDIFRDGNQWCALHGPDQQAGVAGFGDTPEDAVHDLYAELTSAAPIGAPSGRA